MTGVQEPHRETFVLGSASPRRRKLVERLGVPFEFRVAREVDESAVRDAARELVRELARQKAEAVLREGIAEGEGLHWTVLGADTVVAIGPTAADVLGKPADEDDARSMLRRLSGRSHHVYSGIAVARAERATETEVEVTEVRFRSLSETEVAAYVASGEALGKAGAYAIQGQGATLVEAISGCYYNVVGLPLVRTATLLGLSFQCECGQNEHQCGSSGCGARSFAYPENPGAPGTP
jgi:septum formation protein